MDFARRLSGFIARSIPVKPAVLRSARAIASVTFDDFPKSAWQAGGPLLDRYHARATYYTAGSFSGKTEDGIVYYDTQDLSALHRAGHEIGCHGFGHEPTPSLATRTLAIDADRNAQFLSQFLNGSPPVSYAFPFGDVSYRTKRFYSSRFATSRGAHPGVNDGTLDLGQLRTLAIEQPLWNETAILDHIAHAQRTRGWIIFHTHDVSDVPSPYGCTPAMLEAVLKGLTAAGIEILPMREALRVATGEIA